MPKRRWPLLLLAGVVACLPPAAVSPAPAAARAAAALRVELPAGGSERWRIEDDPDRALVASVFSFPSALIAAEAARAMLAALRARDPQRLLLALVDPPAARRLEPFAAELGLRLLETRGGPYSPWPRDPFSFARAAGGAVRLIVRPNRQTSREADADLGPELAQLLPSDVDRAWGGVRWAQAGVPFHNGQVLLTRGAAWATLHTFEPRALQLLGVDRVPVHTFDTDDGIDRYVAAVQRAAEELGALYGRPVRFVHPLPLSTVGSAAARAALLRRLGGGAGYDLDSLVTLLPAPGGKQAALVADVALGQRLLAAAPAAEWARFGAAYGLAAEPDPRPALGAAARSAAAQDLASFLDLLASQLAVEGFSVARLPLLLVPNALLRDPQGLGQGQFLVGWNNVVVELRNGAVRAEGFGSLLPSGDRQAVAAFAAAGARLELLPPLVASVVRNGGYRCASNQLRAP